LDSERASASTEGGRVGSVDIEFKLVVSCLCLLVRLPSN
jgi:hypothetical protein